MATFPIGSAVSRGVIALVALVLAGCTGAPAPDATPVPLIQAPPADTARVARESALAALSIEQLAQRGQHALREHRLYAPAGDNAVEYYLAARRAHAQPDASVESALVDLQPYLVIAAEQALAAGDVDEAERLRSLIAQADPTAPSLAWIGERIAAAAHRRDEVAPDPVPAADVPSVVAAQAQQPTNIASVATTLASAPIPAQPAQPAPASDAPAAEARIASDGNGIPAPATMPTSAPELVAVRTPSPRLSSELQPTTTAAQVTASFTVDVEGSLRDIAVSSVGQRNAGIERSVLTTLRRWKFAPIPVPRTATQRFTFAP